MEKVELNWKRSKIMVFALYSFFLIISILAGFGKSGIAMFAASFVGFSILSYYFLSRVNYAERERLSIPKQPTAQDMSKLYKELSGGWMVTISYIAASVIGSMLTIVLLSVF